MTALRHFILLVAAPAALGVCLRDENPAIFQVPAWLLERVDFKLLL